VTQDTEAQQETVTPELDIAMLPFLILIITAAVLLGGMKMTAEWVRGLFGRRSEK